VTDPRLPVPASGAGTASAAASARTLAVASFVLGVCGARVLPLLGSIAAVVPGHLARRRLADLGGGEGGGFAVTGLWLGYTVVVAAVALLVLPLARAVLMGVTD